jgi:lysophospholipase L1-like esterase
VPLTIDEPVAEKTLKATRVAGGKVQAEVDVEGQAEPGTQVQVSTGCKETACDASDQAEVDNTWAVHVLARAFAGHPSALIKVTNAADTSDVVFVEVRLHAKPLPARKRKRKPLPPATTSPTSPVPTPAAPAPLPTVPAPSTSSPRKLLMIGDSLAVGTQAILPTLLPGWSVTTNAQTGRPLATGMQILAGTQVSGRTALAFSLFTNDDPTHVSQLDSAVRTSVQRAGPRGCAIWATIVRPPVNGVSYAAANKRLNQLANQLPTLRVVPWAAAIAAHPSWVGSDGVHATPTGYRQRAQMYADAARSC